MLNRPLSGIMLALLLISMLTFVFNVQPIAADTGIAELPENYQTRQQADGNKQSNFMISQESLLNEGFNTDVSAEENPKPYSVDEDKWNFDRINEWADFAKVDYNSAEMVIGVDDAKPNSYTEIMKIISENGGNLVNTVSMEGKVCAVVADIPLTTTSSFATDVQVASLSRYIEPNMKFQASFVPNDPYWSQQWGPAKIEADYAWNNTLGNSSVLVAVIDTGIDWNHPDLAANYVPLGYDWVNNDADPMDDNGHGTHCAGIIAAKINNGIGIAGLAQVRIMAEKGLDSMGEGYESNLAKAIIHAVDQGANILSNSWGGYEESTLLREAVKYAYDHGVLVVASAGNDATNLRSYPAAYDEVIAVTATDKNDNPASWTNFGDWVELAAPGVNIYSTMPTYHVTMNDSPYNKAQNYDKLSGTSMACPYVSGVAALVWSAFPNATRDWVRFLLRYTADDLGDSGFDYYYGYGRVNARKAVESPDHDLFILDWERTPYVEPGAVANVNTTVYNLGLSNESDITVELIVNGSVVDNAVIGFLASGESATVNCSWITPTEKGIYRVTSYVVPVPNETVIENNAVSVYVLVGIKTISVPAHYPTIQKAVDAADLGFTIQVNAGTYRENVVVNKEVSIIGENRDTTIINANGIGTVIAVWANNTEIKNFKIINGAYGVYSAGVQGCNISNCYVTNNGYGIWLDSSPNNNSISGNTITKNVWGIVFTSSNNSIVGNNTTTNNQYGVLLYSCSNNSVVGNVFTNDGLVVWDSYGNVVEDNLVNGKPLVYLESVSGVKIEDAGQVILINCDSIDVENLSLSHTSVGIQLWNTTNTRIVENSITDNICNGISLDYSSNNSIYGNNIKNNNWYGIYLYSSSNSSIVGNSITENNLDGIWLTHSSNNSIVGNSITANHYNGVLLHFSSNNSIVGNNITANADGVFLHFFSSNNSIVGNSITENNLDGIWLTHSSNNSIVGNNITANHLDGVCLAQSLNNSIVENNITANVRCGIWLGFFSSNNIIYNNNFENNTLNAYIEVSLSSPSVNVWDNGYPSGGNYWSDYTGIDLYSGPNQDQPGSDGIGDTPYIIDSYNQDHYPLVAHNVAIIIVTTSKTVVGQGLIMRIITTVANRGSYNETFNVTVYANVTAVETHEITLTNGSSTTITFTWNTTGFVKGKYTIKAVADTVTDESDILDNIFIDGIIQVTMKGDCYTDGIIDIFDLVYAAMAFGTKIGNPRYNPNADLNNDGVIDIFDIAIVAINFGETDL